MLCGITTALVRKSAYAGAPRAKLPAVIFATLVVFGNQKKTLAQRNRNSAICAHMATASLYEVIKPRSMPKAELGAFGVVVVDGEELKSIPGGEPPGPRGVLGAFCVLSVL